jgi:murein DD-endopeptidase MepM/ murein hydrolase activator NlpD
MMTTSRRLTVLGWAAFALVAASLMASAGRNARAANQNPTPTLPPPHFGLPFGTPPGASTWYVSQFYGNTPFAYSLRNSTYSGSQGLHSGVDFGAPCGTPVVAIGDGMVVEVDNPVFGLVPHELTLQHPGGYLSFYGHLLETPTLAIGDQVRAGQVIAKTGDPDETCHSRPHLHLEIRDWSYRVAYDPVTLIDADWDSLALFGPYEPFARDLDQPRRWVTPPDQPDLRFGDPPYNDYQRPWPPLDW